MFRRSRRFPLQVLPTRSIYEFEDAGVHVTLTFMTAALPHDLDIFSRPLSYLTWDVRSVDGATHEVSLYDSTSSELVVNRTNELVEWSRVKAGKLTALRVGTQEQPILGSSGDDHRIDWGYAYAAALTKQSKSAIGANQALLDSFVQNGSLPATDDSQMPRAVNDNTPVLAFVFDLGSVGAKTVERQVIVAYDEIYAIKYFGKNLRPYWRRNGMEPAELLQAAAKDYPSLLKRCEKFDRGFDGGHDESWRRALCADLRAGLSRMRRGLRFGGGCEQAAVVLHEGKHEQWRHRDGGRVFPDGSDLDFLEPDIWPRRRWFRSFPMRLPATGNFPMRRMIWALIPTRTARDDGGEGMPVEESGNMLILCDAIAQAEGNADFVTPWWPQLTQWAKYLENYGLDPEEQLCTDDFMGHLAHNANLSVKAILGLAAYGNLCKMRGDNCQCGKIRATCKSGCGALGEGGRRWRSFPACVRQARNVEPEI